MIILKIQSKDKDKRNRKIKFKTTTWCTMEIKQTRRCILTHTSICWSLASKSFSLSSSWGQDTSNILTQIVTKIQILWKFMTREEKVQRIWNNCLESVFIRRGMSKNKNSIDKNNHRFFPQAFPRNLQLQSQNQYFFYVTRPQTIKIAIKWKSIIL